MSTKLEVTSELIMAAYKWQSSGLSEEAYKRLIMNYIPNINAFLNSYGINTRDRLVHFLAQILHESAGFTRTREMGSAKYFMKYEGSKILGNVRKGDGVRFKGRGLIQITGRWNYTAMYTSWRRQYDILNHPELVETPLLAVRSAFWYWTIRHCNKWADTKCCMSVTKAVNGGLNGLAQRELLTSKLYELCV